MVETETIIYHTKVNIWHTSAMTAGRQCCSFLLRYTKLN